MKKRLRAILKWLTAVTCLLLLAFSHGYVEKNDFHRTHPLAFQASENRSDNAPLIVSLDQLLPPYINAEGSGVRQVEPPASTTTRITTDDDSFRLAYSSQLIALKLSNSHLTYLLHLTQCEQAGFYLYELCKLLI